MPKTTKRQLQLHHFIRDRLQLVSLPLYNEDDVVILEERDFNELMDLGLSLTWTLRHGVVWVRCNGRAISVARLILDLGSGQVVKYLDKNPTNLRRSNLVVSNGPSKHRARDNMEPSPLRYQIFHTYG